MLFIREMVTSLLCMMAFDVVKRLNVSEFRYIGTYTKVLRQGWLGRSLCEDSLFCLINNVV